MGTRGWHAFWENIQSIFPAARDRGADVKTAYAIETAPAAVRAATPVDLIVMLALYGVALKRALRDRENVRDVAADIAQA